MSSSPRLSDPSLLIELNLVDGEWKESRSGKRFEVVDPSTESLIGTCPESTDEDAQEAIDAAARALPAWRSRTGRDRSRILRRWYELIRDNSEDLATLIGWENGKAKPDAAGEVASAASFIEWYSEEAARIYGDIIPHSVASLRVSILKEPIGVCGLITPWNFPAGMVTRKLGPALAAGCTVVLKSAGETPYTAAALVSLAERSGVPKGVINLINALDNSAEIGHALCTSEVVRKISFTGSTRVGRLLMKQSSDSLVDDAVSDGAQVAFGGKKLPDLGPNFFQPTILTNVKDEMTVCQTEIFGPIAPIIRFTSEEEVIKKANSSDAGLASYLFTQDVHRATRLTEKLHFGMVSLNTSAIADAASPFGGIKQSGLGREGSKYGIEDYLQLKTVVSGGNNNIN